MRGKYPTVLPSKAYEVWEKQARLAMAIQLRGYKPTVEDVHVNAQIYYKGPRPDLSGALESLGDCCESYIWENDRQIVSWDGSRLFHDIVNPRTEILITKGE